MSNMVLTDFLPGVIFVRDDLKVLQEPNEGRDTPTQTGRIRLDKNNLEIKSIW
jgi:hypothetical protein